MTNEVLQKTASDEQNVSSSNGLEPSIRFPKFNENYKTINLSEYLFENKDRNKSEIYTKQEVLSVSGEFGIVNQIKLQGRSFAGESVKEYHIVETNDIVYTKSPLKANPYGIIKVNKGIPGIVSTLYAVYHVKNTAFPEYIDYYFSNDLRLNKYLKPLVNIGAKHDMKVNNETVLIGCVTFPKVEEQQKVSNFLSLIDRRIEKQRQLVESLKKYKRGALSRVFNDVLETVKLSDISNFISSARTLSTTLNGNKGIYPVYDAAGIAGYIDYYDIDSDYITIVKDGSGVGRLQKCDKKSSFIGTLGALVAKNCTTDFLYAVLQTIDFSKFVTGMAIPHIYYRDYKSTLLPFPSEEKQHFISQLFKKFDIHIENETQKLTNMLAYKQGLLQQMFI